MGVLTQKDLIQSTCAAWVIKTKERDVPSAGSEQLDNGY